MPFYLRVMVVSSSIDTHNSDQGRVVAAVGSRKHAKAHWSYASNAEFLARNDAPWSGLGLAAFRATSKAGVEAWLQWIVEHTPQAGSSASAQAVQSAASK